uniref:Uncharacterized protein n=1 Tax=Ditylenchus dipsaci TaxID=166011 RepID=A0A915EAB9_9BILA
MKTESEVAAGQTTRRETKTRANYGSNLSLRDDSSSGAALQPNAQMASVPEEKPNVSFGSDTKETINDSLDLVDNANQLKEPIRLLTAKVYGMETRLSDGFSNLQNEVRDGFKAIDSRFAHFLGTGKDDVSGSFENPPAKMEEIDLYSFDKDLKPPFIFGECTVGLISEQKLAQCIRKRDSVMLQHKVNPTDVAAYLLTMRISPEQEEHLTEVARKNKIILQIVK